MGLRKAKLPDSLHAVQPRAHARDVSGLLAQLRSGSAEARRWAARDLAAHPQAVPALAAQLALETDDAAREALFTSLAAQPGDATAAALLPLLRSDDAALRNGAIEALATMPQAVAPHMAALLVDADADVRIFSINLLGELRHPQVADWLLQVLAQEQHVNVVAAAVEVLAEVGAPPHAAALRAAAERFADDSFIGFAVAMALDRVHAG